MSQPSKLVGRRVLVIGAQGVLGALLVRGFEQAGWKVTRGGRRPDGRSDFLHVDLDEPETVATAIGHADVVLNPVPDGGLVAERMVLDQGGLLINVSAMPAAAGRRLRRHRPRGHQPDRSRSPRRPSGG
jgi:prephenate dehydrogenase